MLILGIETSCDETSFALLEGEGRIDGDFITYINSFEVKSSIVASQIENHIQYGGIVPEVGARLHAQQIHYIFSILLKNYTIEGDNQVHIGTDNDLSEELDITRYINILQKLDTIYVTTNPGLVSALRVGYEFAKTLQYFIMQKFRKTVEIVEINHLHGHIFSCFYQQDQQKSISTDIFPHLHLIVSGGNSQLLMIHDPHNIEIVGQTLDDAAGECLDKIGRMLGLPYPGGLNLAKVAGVADENVFNFPIGMNKNTTLNYSFSGLKTSVRLFIESNSPVDFRIEEALTKDELDLLRSVEIPLPPKLDFIKKVAVSAQSVVIAQLINKYKKAIKCENPKSFGISGGVSANLLLRKKIQNVTETKVFIPPLYLTGDNAIMIALAGVAKKYKKI